MKQTSIDTIKAFLEKYRWINPVHHISFLAAGEYNENYKITEKNGRAYVFRINHGSQLGLSGKEQITYEYNVLTSVEPSGVTPRPLRLEAHAPEIEKGVLLMEYLPGRPLNYRKDLAKAAEIFSKIHSLPVNDALITQINPIVDIAEESLGLIDRYPEHPLKAHREKILKYHEYIVTLGTKLESEFRSNPLSIVNTEVNSHNFLIDEHGAYLVDWEKAVISSRYQDLGHFTVSTTTQWKGNYLLSREEKKQFLCAYRERASLDISLEELTEITAIMEKTILLRALSWCYMAYYEYTAGDRALKNSDTFIKIQDYLDNIDRYITED